MFCRENGTKYENNCETIRVGSDIIASRENAAKSTVQSNETKTKHRNCSCTTDTEGTEIRHEIQLQ